MIRFLILGLLRDGKPRHGYAMMKEHRDGSGLQLSIGNFYRETARLLTDGLVRAADNPPDADKRRLPYQITERGASAFDAWLAVPDVTASSDYQDELSLRVFLAGHAGSSLGTGVLDAWREELVLRRTVLQRAAIGGLRDGEQRAELALRDMLVARRLGHIGVDLELLDAFRATRKGAADDHKVRRRPARSGHASNGKVQHRRATA